MKKIILLGLATLFSYTINAQQQASNWFFGDGAGITFNNDGTITPTTGNLFTDEGCTSISDENGDLLFYTDGIFVYDRNGDLMPNGTGLLGNPSSTQSGLIVPKPQDPNVYYIFTVDTFFQNDPDQGFHFSEVDMTLNGGLGDVVATNKNTNLLQDSSEKISAVLKNCETQNVWVVTFTNDGGFPTPNSPNNFDRFYAYEVTATGVNTTPEVSVINNLVIDEQRGYLKFSPDGMKLAMANIDEGLFLFDFDPDTGIVTNVNGATNPLSLAIPANNGAIFSYGIEFSPNGDFLYVSSYNNFFVQPPGNPENNNPANHFGSLFQFDISVAPLDIQGTAVALSQANSYRTALQLGPDGKIYRTTSESYDNGRPFLSVINEPNQAGLAANYQQDAVALTRNSRQGLPPFIASFFVETIDIINDPDITTNDLPLCDGDTYTLSAELLPDATYTWSVDGVPQPQQPTPNEFEVTTNGLYEVLIEFTNGDCNTFEGVADVQYFSNVSATAPENSAPMDSSIDVCDNADNDEQFSFPDFDVQIPNIIGAQDPNDFNIKYYTSLDDANNDEDEIAFPFTNTVNNQPIFVRVENRLNPNCFTTTDTNTGETIQFFLNVFDMPMANPVDPVSECDNEGDTTDGVMTFTLSDFNPTILGPDQDAADYTITYHANSADALAGMPVLNNSYQNQPFNDEIFYRIENNLNTQCFSTNSISITVNLSPTANDIDLFQCDEDGIPDARTSFNITEKNDEVTGGDPNFTVAYYLNMTDAMNEVNEIDGSNYENTINPQTLVSRVTDTTTGCFSFANVTLRVSATSANDAFLGICDSDGDEDGFADFDLSMADAQVLDGLPAGLDLVYYPTLDDALLEQNPLPNDYRNTTAFNETIFVRVENDNDCYGINEVELEVFTLPNVETEFETLYCLNNFPEPIVINGGVINDIPNNYYYEWSTGETTIEIEVNEPGTYTVVVSNVEGCSKTRTVVVEASNIATIDDIQVTDASTNNTVTVLVSGEGDYVFSLDDPNGPYQTSNVFDNVRPGIYSVFVRDENGCGISEDLISVVGFPKFFTPNGDSQNDFWQVKGISDQFQPGTVIYIYDRHGKLISEVNPLSSGWDGTYNGNPMPASDYWFSVTLQDGRQFSSHFALKR